MTWHGFKTTFPAVAPLMVVADLDILSRAPLRMALSGAGDILGKFLSIADWKIAHLLTGEAICRRIVELEEQALDRIINGANKLSRGSAEDFRALTEGLLLSGIAMQMCGSSRPASGAEHHISHFIEMLYETDDRKYLHGDKVGAATVLLADLYRRFAASPRTLGELSILNETQLASVFGELTEGILAENKENHSLGITPVKWNEKLPEIGGAPGSGNRFLPHRAKGQAGLLR
jgi:glycerol-1-phosphate dehydrogenase [NAD(P)+]